MNTGDTHSENGAQGVRPEELALRPQSQPASRPRRRPRRSLQALKKWLIVFGAFSFAWTSAIVIHELGHALATIATGGVVKRIEASPLGYGWAHLAYAPERAATSWGAFLAAGAPVLLLLVLWVFRSRLSFWAAMLALVCLGRSGFYLWSGALIDGGDPAHLIHSGVSAWALCALGSVLLLLSVAVALPLGPLLGVGRGRCSLWRSLLILAVPALAYLAILSPLVFHFPPLGAPGTFFFAEGAVVLGLGVLVHFAAGLTRGRETRARSVLARWREVGVSLALAGTMISVALVWFPRRWDPSEALHHAMFDCDAGAVQAAIDAGADLNAVQDGRTPLVKAIRYGNLRVAELLVRRGADVNKKDLILRYTPLHWAVFYRRPKDFVEFLIASGADIRATDSHGYTPLHLAAVEDEPDLVKVLADAGADVNVKSLDGNTPLHYATMWRGRGAAAAPLIERGADVNAKNSFGLTPIHYAVMRDRYEVVKLLIQHGADLAARDKNGRNAWAWALLGCRSSSEVPKLLRSHGAEK